MCPLIGRYNQGDYAIGEVCLHLEFVCAYEKQSGGYRCGGKRMGVPEPLVFALRNIPEFIPYNKLKNMKN
jgi:hypothetical protein